MVQNFIYDEKTVWQLTSDHNFLDTQLEHKTSHTHYDYSFLCSHWFCTHISKHGHAISDFTPSYEPIIMITHIYKQICLTKESHNPAAQRQVRGKQIRIFQMTCIIQWHSFPALGGALPFIWPTIKVIQQLY